MDELYDPDDKDIDVEEVEDQSPVENDTDENDVELRRDVHALSSISGDVNINAHSATGIDLNEKSPYCVVSDGSGNAKVVRKSSICWLLTSDKHVLSSDRLTRVKQCELIPKSKF